MDSDKISERKRVLEELIKSAILKKQEILRFVFEITRDLNSGKISKSEYFDKLHQKLGFKSAEEWVRDYDEYIKSCERQMDLCDSLLKQKSTKKIIYTSNKKKIDGSKVLKLMIFLVLGIIAVFFIYNFSPILLEKSSDFFSNAKLPNIQKSSNADFGELASSKPGYNPDEIKINSDNSFTSGIVEKASPVVGKKVLFKASVNSSSGFKISLPGNSEVSRIYDSNNQSINSVVDNKEESVEVKVNNGGDVFIDYALPGPVITSGNVNTSGERVAVYSNIHYTDVLSNVKIPELSPEQKVKIYRIVNENGIESKELVKSISYDTDEDGISDRVEWIVPHLSYEVYEIIIEISRAEHLDSEKNFISDIFENVSKLDDIWSEAIYSGEYLLVSFESELDNEKDITLYTRASSENTFIEVYDYYTGSKISEFPVINSSGKYSMILSGLEGKSDRFYLKVVNIDNNPRAYLEFDYIVDPLIIIRTCADLDNVRSNLAGNYILANNIDCNVAPYNVAPYFSPIGSYSTQFYGRFNGNGFVIRNVKILRYTTFGENGVGLFGSVSNPGVIENLGVEDINIKAGGSNTNAQYVGGVVGYNTGIINKTYVIGNITTETGYKIQYVGGVAGYNIGKIENSFANVNISIYGTDNGIYSGGLVGATYGGSINNCYSIGNVSTSSYYIGGFAGYSSSNIKNSYSTGKVYTTYLSYPEYKGGFAGSGSVINCYYTDNTYNNNNNPIGTYETIGRSAFYSSVHAVYTADPVWDFTNLWRTTASFPVLRVEDFSNVFSNCGELNKPNTVYYLTGNINRNDLTSACIVISADNIVLDCLGYSITSDDNYAGIISAIKKNITIKNCTIDMGNGVDSYGIRFDSVINSTILGNTFKDQNYGIFFYNSKGTLIANNSIEVLSSHDGIALVTDSSNNSIYNNTIVALNNGIYLASVSNNNTFSKNKIITQQNGVELIGVANNTFVNNSLINNYYNANGFYLFESNQNYFLYNNISGFFNGFSLSNSKNNIFANNNVSLIASGSHGFYFSSTSSDNLIKDCINVSAVGGDFYLLGSSKNNSVLNCSGNFKVSVFDTSELFRKWYYRAFVIDNSQADARDSAGINHGTLMNGASISGMYGGSKYNVASLDGVNDYIDTGDYSNLNAETGGYAISLWIDPTAASKFILSKGGNSASGYYVLLDSNSKIKVRFSSYDKNAQYVEYLTNNALSSGGSGHHLVINRINNGYVEIYVDGVNQSLIRTYGAPSSVTNVSTDLRLRIGSYNGVSGFYQGIIDEIKIWNTSLSAEDVMNDYKYAGYVKNENLVSYYTFDGAVANANVTGYNSTGDYVFNLTTDSSGYTRVGEIIDYVVNRSGVTSYSPYAIGATNTTLYDNHAFDASKGNNLFDIFTLRNGFELRFESPTPLDEMSTFNRNVSINVSITSPYFKEFKFNWNGTNYTIYNDSLVLMYNFDNRNELRESTLLVKDLSRYGNNGDVSGLPWWWEQYGKYNGGYYLNGADKYIESQKNLGITGNQPRTIAFWEKLNLILYDGGAFVSTGGWTNGKYFGVLCYHNNWYFNGYGSGYDWNTGVNCNTDWNYHVITYDGTKVRWYINGNELGNGADLSLNTDDGKVRIGSRPYGSMDLNGQVDELRIWNRVLNKSEIYEQYVSNLNKVNSTTWYFFINQSKDIYKPLDFGNYTYFASAKDLYFENKTETRRIFISPLVRDPLIRFEQPTLDNNAFTDIPRVIINASITSDALKEMIYNFNGTNYTIYNDSLVLMMNFDKRNELGESDSVFKDLSKYENHGGCINCPLWSSSGKYNGAFNFDGVNDYMIVPSTADTMLRNNLYTIGMWVNIRSVGPNGYAELYSVTGGSIPGRTGIKFTTTGIGMDAGGDFKNVFVPVNINFNKWYHIVGQIDRNSNKFKVYVNGNYIGEDTFNAYVPTSSDVRIGGNFLTGNSYDTLDGMVDEVRIWNYTLSASEIYEHYISNLNRLNSTTWYFSANQSKNPLEDLDLPSYTYSGYIIDILSVENITDTRTIRINQAPRILQVTPTQNPPLNEYGGPDALVPFSFVVYDANGLDNLYNAKASGNYTNSCNTPYCYLNDMRNSTPNCNYVDIQGDPWGGIYVGKLVRKYLCQVPMKYYDEPQEGGVNMWSVIANISDLNGLKAGMIVTNAFSPQPLNAFDISISDLTWPTLGVTSINQVSQNPITLINTGNIWYNGADDSKRLRIKGWNLYKSGDASKFISANNFYISTSSSSSCISDGILLQHNSQVIKPTLDLKFGDLNQPSTAKQNLFVCLKQVDSGLAAGSYSTHNTGGSSWTLTLSIAVGFAGAGTVAGKKKKKKEILKEIEKKLRERYGINVNELLSSSDGLKIPVSVFKTGIGASESLCRYLKDVKKFRYSEIAKILNRDQRTVWVNYNNSLSSKDVKFESSAVTIPVEIFSNRKLSVLESLILYLRENGYKNSDIAKLTGKDARNIATFYTRAKRKK